jgi:hypothetical protein
VHHPVVRLVAVRSDLAAPEVNRQVAAEVVIVEEIVLDDLALVAQCDAEFVEPVARVVLEDVPEDRPAADLHHRLGLGLGFLGQPGAEATGQDHGLHQAVTSIPTAHRAQSGAGARVGRNWRARAIRAGRYSV